MMAATNSTEDGMQMKTFEELVCFSSSEGELRQYAKLYYVRPFPGLLFSFFPIIESEISEQGSRQVATEEPNKGLCTYQAP